MASLEAALLRAVDLLERHQLRYAVIGGLALAQWGVSRATRDVDLKVAVPETDYDSVRDLLTSGLPDPGRPGLPPNTLVVSVIAEGVIVDFLLALPGYDTEIMNRAVEREVSGRSIWFSSAEDLVVQKMIANRDRDWVDVEALLVSQRGRIDLGFIRSWAGQFAEALDRPELVDRLEELLRSSAVGSSDFRSE